MSLSRLGSEDRVSRTVYAVDLHGEVVAFQPVAAVSGWTDASDDVIHRTAQGVFLGFGLLRPQDLIHIRFIVEAASADGTDAGAHFVAERGQLAKADARLPIVVIGTMQDAIEQRGGKRP